MKTALLIGRDYGLSWALPQLLARAGFCVDVISSSPLMKCCKFVRDCRLVPFNRSLLPIIEEMIRRSYDWIIVAEDGVLAEVLASDFPLETKLKILPIQRQENLVHLYSKVGLSKVFSEGGVPTPPFLVAGNLQEALSKADQLGYPLLLKQDSSCGGNGVFEIDKPSDLKFLDDKIFHRPVLLQKEILGDELDLSALYLGGNLIHFNHAKTEKFCYKFGISSLRTYTALSSVDEEVFRELAHIGKVLGAKGFVNITCIQSEGRRFYFEADMRPNAWVEFPRFFGEDPAIRIEKWFSEKKTLSYPVAALPNQPSQILLPYFLRLNRFELLFNRYDVWKFIPKDDPKLIRKLLRIFAFSCGRKRFFMFALKRIIPKRYHKSLRKLKAAILAGPTIRIGSG